MLNKNQYIWPPEWEAQNYLIVTWPHSQSDFSGTLEQLDPLYIELARVISPYQSMIILAFDERHKTHIGNLLRQYDISLTNIFLIVIPTNDVWIRDYGPLRLIDSANPSGNEQLINFEFNAWGNKYAHHYDNDVSNKLIETILKPYASCKNINMVLEGGSIDTDGNGTLLTTSQCLQNPNRNPQLNKQAIEESLSEHLGIKQVLWVNHGSIIGDDTDSHIDMLARFANSKTIVYQSCADTNDPHYGPLAAMAEELATFKNIDGNNYNLISLPLPAAQYDDDGHRLAASYANFLITNQVVVVPVYNTPQDNQALEQFTELFPDKIIAPLDCRPLIRQCGSIHCATICI